MRRFVILSVSVLIILSFILAGCSSQPAFSPAPAPTSSPAPTSAAPKTTAPAPTSVPVPSATTPAASAGKQIELRFVSFQVTNNPEFIEYKNMLIDKVNELGKGKVNIRILGGPEIMPPNDIALAIQRGVMDMAYVPTGNYDSVVPGCDIIRLSRVIERDIPGCFEYIQGLYKDKGMFYLGRKQAAGSEYFYVSLKKTFKTKADFVGQKVAGAAASFNPGYKAVGFVPLNIPLTEYYAAIERGVVDGVAASLSYWFTSSVYQKSPNIIDHPFYKNQVTIVLNQDKWNSLPPDVQKLLMDNQIEYEKNFVPVLENSVAGLKKKATEAGGTFTKLPAEEAKWWLDSFYDEGWKYDYARYPKEVVTKLEGWLKK